MNEIRKATDKDIDTILEMIENGRKHIRTYNISQWVNGYPSRQTISDDILNDLAYVFIIDEKIQGYCAILNHDKCYDEIDGKWQNNGPYIAVHRMVTNGFNKGLGSLFFDELKKTYSHIRIDTHEGNISMNKCLLKNNFIYCGIIKLESGNLRNAYEYIK